MILQAVPDWKKPDVEKNWGRMLAFSLGLHLLLLIFFFQWVPRGQSDWAAGGGLYGQLDLSG